MDNQAQATENVYILDTNILINFSLWCPVEFNREFWFKLESLLEAKKWVLLDVVYNESAYAYDREFKLWLKKQKDKKMVIKIGDDVKNRAIEINSQYPMINNATGNSTGDTYIVAYAEINHLNIFTHEKKRDTANDLYKIPDVCDELHIKCIRYPRQFMKQMGFKNSNYVNLINTNNKIDPSPSQISQ